jgi:WD domain, G-beta repeat/APAF-1 helical domain
MHDVVRDYLRAQLGQHRLAELTGTLLDAVAADRPAASPPDPAAGRPARMPWWEMNRDHRYLWDHVIEHLLEAGRPAEAEAVAVDLRWVEARLEQFGPAAPAADLAAAGTPQAARLQAVLTRTAHLLAPTEPAGAVVDVLHSRVAEDPYWGPQATALGHTCSRPRLVNRWPLPDLAGTALQRVLTGHSNTVQAVAVAPDGSWLASGSGDGTVRIWDVATGSERATLKGHTRSVEAVAVAPNGSWLASGGWDGTVRIWDVATGQVRTLIRVDGSISAAAWVGSNTLAIGGSGGLYLFGFLTDASHVT